MAGASLNAVIQQHLIQFFAGHSHEKHRWTLGPALDELPELRVIEFTPGSKTNLWVYATIGAWKARKDPQLEFVIAAPEQDLRHVELLSMAAWYHGRYGLDTGHTLPIGEPWLRGSNCKFFLVSNPYPFGPEFEVCNFSDGHVHILWLLPITEAERRFKMNEGLEALEQRFDESGLLYWVSDRSSVV